MPPKQSQPQPKKEPQPEQRVERPLTAEESNLIKTTVNYLNAVMTQNAQLPAPPPTRFWTVHVPAISLEDYLKRHLLYLRLKEHHLIYLCIYVDRFFATNSDYLHSLNAHRLLVSLLLVAIKYTDDAHYNNTMHAKCAGITLGEINQLETEALRVLNFNLYVSKKDYLLCKEFLANYSMNGLGAFFTAKDRVQLTKLNTHNNAMHTPPQATLKHSEGQNDLLLSNPFEPLESEAAASSAAAGISQMSSADFADACLASPVTTAGRNTQPISHADFAYGSPLPLPLIAATSGICEGAFPHQMRGAGSSYASTALSHMAATSGFYGSASSQQLSSGGLSYGNVPLSQMPAANGLYRGVASQQIRSADLSAAYLASPETVMGRGLYEAAPAPRMNSAAFLDALYDSSETAAATHFYGGASRPQMIFSAQAALPLAAAASSAANAVSQEITHAADSSSKLQLPVALPEPPELHHKKRVREDSPSFFRPSAHVAPTSSSALFNAPSEAQEVLGNNGEQAKPSQAAKKAKIKHTTPPPIEVGINKQSLFAASMDKEAVLPNSQEPRV